MARKIKLTEQDKQECLELFAKELNATKMIGGKVSFSRLFSSSSQKATVFYTPTAWIKMTSLVSEFSSEVAWHGVAERMEQPGQYLISDIVVYPQTVSGATVDMDEEKYAFWLMEHCEDERFNHLFMQGHSHVNMAVSPSGTDTKHQQDILDMMTEDGFYIFQIWNKRGECYSAIYDFRDNTMYENADVTNQLAGTEDVAGFIASAKDIVKPRTTVVTPVKTSEPAKGAIYPVSAVNTPPKKEKKPASTYNYADKPAMWYDDDEYVYGKTYYGGSYR